MIVRFYAIGREISGRNEYTAVAGTVAELRTELESGFGQRMAQLFDASSLLYRGRRLQNDSDVSFETDDVVDLLPPFAGG